MSNFGKINAWTCEVCGIDTVCVDVNVGVTPFMLRCLATRGCKGMAQSNVYRRADQAMEPQHEWFRPESIDAYLDANVEPFDRPGMLYHLEQGGLVLRPIAVPVADDGDAESPNLPFDLGRTPQELGLVAIQAVTLRYAAELLEGQAGELAPLHDGTQRETLLAAATAIREMELPLISDSLDVEREVLPLDAIDKEAAGWRELFVRVYTRDDHSSKQIDSTLLRDLANQALLHHRQLMHEKKAEGKNGTE